MDRVEKRRRWMARRRLEGWRINRIAEALRVNEKTVDRWCSIHRKYGWECLRVKSKALYTYWKTPQETHIGSRRSPSTINSLLGIIGVTNT